MLVWLFIWQSYDVLHAGEKAVSLAPDKMESYRSRGLAKALTRDIGGALADFQTILDNKTSILSLRSTNNKYSDG